MRRRILNVSALSLVLVGSVVALYLGVYEGVFLCGKKYLQHPTDFVHACLCFLEFMLFVTGSACTLAVAYGVAFLLRLRAMCLKSRKRQSRWPGK